MNHILIENIHALLDAQQVPKCSKSRASYLAQNSEANVKEVELFLKGKGPLSKGVLQKVADFFEVDVYWLAGKM